METEDNVLYHCGPVMRKEGEEWRIISAGPTTSIRMESLEKEFIERFGIRVIIGKGGMGKRTLQALQDNGAVYVHFTGGAGALAAVGLGRVKNVYLLEKLGMAEAVWVFEAREFGPLVVAMDSKGASLYDIIDEETKSNLERLLRGL